MKLFAIPYAGGNSYCYRPLSAAVENEIQWETLELPGRGKRLGERLLETIEELAADVLRQIEDRCSSAFALFGHSMGGLVAHRVATMMQQGNIRAHALTHLILSGCRPPQFLDRGECRASLSRDELIIEIEKLGGLPTVIRQDEEMMAFFEPILRADFGAVDQYRLDEPLCLAIHGMVLSGRDDQEVTSEHISGWRGAFNRTPEFHELPGEHFFFADHSETLGILISTFLLSNSRRQEGVIE
ncbi:MAG: thioesterase [Gammaproteobacteria bacterium]|nr:thioesterase [Gammaproteobacteria bacterium]